MGGVMFVFVRASCCGCGGISPLSCVVIFNTTNPSFTPSTALITPQRTRGGSVVIARV